MKGATLTGDAAFELRPDARRFELFEASPALRLGLGAAIRYAQSFGMPAIERRIKVLGSSLRKRLEELSGVSVYDKGLEKGGIVCFSVGQLEAEQVAKQLSEQRINVSVSAPTSTWFDSSHRRLPPLVRASVHYYNTEEELDSLSRSLAILT